MHKRSGVFPIPKANTVVIRSTTKIEDYTEDEQSDNSGDFDGREDELGLPIYT